MLMFGLLPMVATPALANIACDDDFQIVDGREIATPFCSDKALARAARRDGDKVTGREIRSNPGLKAEVCRFVGSNPAVSSDCADSED
jgi:hypothetical protein